MSIIKRVTLIFSYKRFSLWKTEEFLYLHHMQIKCCKHLKYLNLSIYISGKCPNPIEMENNIFLLVNLGVLQDFVIDYKCVKIICNQNEVTMFFNNFKWVRFCLAML